MRIGLIIPAYNEEKLIGTTLEHVARSGHHFSEIIVVDNASTDRTAEIAASFPGVKVVRENKKGVQNARQRGYLESKADILAFVDADCRMPKGWFTRIEKAFANNPQLVLVSGPYHYPDISWYNKVLLWIYWICIAMPTYWIIAYMAIFGNVAVRRETLDKMGGINTGIEFYGDDTDLAFKAKKYGKVKFSPFFVMVTSGRRLLNKGTVKTAIIYSANFVSQVFLKKPYHGTHDNIR